MSIAKYSKDLIVASIVLYRQAEVAQLNEQAKEFQSNRNGTGNVREVKDEVRISNEQNVESWNNSSKSACSGESGRSCPFSYEGMKAFERFTRRKICQE